MNDHTHAYLGGESGNRIAAAAVTAGLIPDDYEFMAIAQMPYANLPTAELHLDGNCAKGRFTRVSAAELRDLATKPFNPERWLCSRCEEVLEYQVPGAEEFPHDALRRLAAAVRIVARLQQTADTLADQPTVDSYLATGQLDAAVRDDAVIAVGEARLFLGQYRTEGDARAQQLLAEHRDFVQTWLGNVTYLPMWQYLEDDLTRDSEDTYDWVIISANEFNGFVDDARKASYATAVELFAAGATLEAYAPTVGRPMSPVLRYRHGIALPEAAPAHLVVAEADRPLEVMRLAFESADPAIYFDVDVRDAWFDAVAAATLETAGA